MPYWTLVVSQANKERLATQNISNQGYEYYLPLFREKIVKQNNTIDVTKVLFPRYIFVKVRQQWASLTGTYGVSGLVMEGTSPKVIPERVIEKIRSREDKDGFITIEEKDKLSQGDSVKLAEGPLKDSIGIYQGMSNDERAVVLFKILGSEREFKVPPKLLIVV